ncbi:hypothetical protein KAR91_87965 [Candidatus Pacearchaeota archaeon]|nr:hypothetical protein [Candidatus Pacearchaeota archaeon]
MTDDEKKESDTIEVKKDVIMGLYKFMTARLTHPHGEDVYAEKREKHPKENGKFVKTRVHTHHYHRSNMAQALEHDWHHLLGDLIGIHPYEVVNK